MNNKNQTNKLNPWFVSGFVDAEGSFVLSIVEHLKSKLGFSVRFVFIINLHRIDINILYKIKEFFGGIGKVAYSTDGRCYFRVENHEDIYKIINHFNNYPLRSKKGIDFELFKKAFFLKKNNSFSHEILQQIVNTKATMNFEELSDKLRNLFPNTNLVEKPVIDNKAPLTKDWICGFTDGEGCFTINVYNRKDTVTGRGVKLVFKLTQHNRSLDVLEKIAKYFNCGKIYNQSKVKNSKVMDFMVTGLSDNLNIIIPFFLNYPLETIKKAEFERFLKVAYLMQNKAHLTKEGLTEIIAIKDSMNKR